MSDTKTALLLFSRTTKEESRFKRLISRKNKANSALIKSMSDHALKVAVSSGFEVFHISQNQQEGHDFGNKLANAFERIFSAGFDQVISIGNDCPELKASDIQKAQVLLQKKDFVFGPDSRGGLYLIGINQQSFDKANFIRQKWKQKDLWSAWSHTLKNEHVQFSELAVISDVNFHEDLMDLSRRLQAKNQLKHLILFWIQKVRITFQFEDISISKPRFYSNLFHRPPPVSPNIIQL